jgi:hypothetical protein
MAYDTDTLTSRRKPRLRTKPPRRRLPLRRRTLGVARNDFPRAIQTKSVGKAVGMVSNRRSVKLCRSGKGFTDRTYSDRQRRSAKLIPDRLSVGVSGFPDQLNGWGSSVVV